MVGSRKVEEAIAPIWTRRRPCSDSWAGKGKSWSRYRYSHTFHRRMQHFVGELLANCMASTPGTLTPAVAAVRPKLRDQGPPAQIQAAANGEMDGAGVRGRNPRGRERGLRGKW